MERIGDVARARLDGGRGEPAEPPEPTEPGLPGERAELERTGEASPWRCVLRAWLQLS